MAYIVSMKQRAKVDVNQKAIVKVLRSVGATVTPTHQLGKGFPDIVVGYRGTNFLIEIKDSEQPPSKRKLTPDEQKWHDDWRGTVHIVNNEQDALKAIGASK